MRQTMFVLMIGTAAAAAGALMLTYGSTWGPTNGGVPFRELAQGERSSVATRANYLITSDSEYSLLWGMIDTDVEPPTVDFNTESVMAIFAGQASTAGHDIRLERIEDGISRKVFITLIEPNANCLTAEVITQPYQIVAVSKTALPLTHEDKVVTRSCLK